MSSLTSSKIFPSAGAFPIHPHTSTGLVLRIGGGYLIAGRSIWQAVLATEVVLADYATNFVEISPIGVISSNTTGFSSGAVFLYEVFTSGGTVTSIQDWRSSPNTSAVVGRALLVETPPKVGATAGWVVGAANNLGKMATLPASQTGSTLVMPITGLHVGETITGFSINGSIQSAGVAATLTADLRKLTAAAAGATDASIGAMAAPLSVTSNTIVSAANAVKTGLSEVVAAGVSYYLLITATTGASCTEEIGSAVISLAAA
jgi:hypothetical protein